MSARIKKQTHETGIPGPLPLDIALGRGGMANNHVGNKAFRNIVSLYKERYAETELAIDKKLIVKQVASHLSDSGFRFVEKKQNGLWIEASAKKARYKLGQALREGVPQVRIRTVVPGGGKVQQKEPVSMEDFLFDEEASLEADWVPVQAGSNDAIFEEESLEEEYDMVPMAVDYNSCGIGENLDVELLDDEYIDILLDLFGLLDVQE